MADEVPETAGAATRNLLGAIGFIILLLGGEMMAEKTGDRFWWGVGLVCGGVPIFFGGVFWKWIRTRIGPAIAARVDLFTTDPREMAVVSIVGLIVLRSVTANNWTWAGAAGAALAIFLFNWRYFKRPTIAAPQPAKVSSLDGQANLDLIHLLDFASNQTTLVWLSDLIMKAPDSAVRPPKLDGDTESAQASSDFVRHVSIQLGQGTFRRQEFLNWMAQAESEAESQVERMTSDQRPKGIDPLVVRRCAIANLQAHRAFGFLCHERHEVEQRLITQRPKLIEHLRLRSPN